MKTGLRIIAFAMGLGCLIHAQAQTNGSIFPKGELSPAKNHTGNIWLNELVMGDSTFDPGIAVATYDAGAKLDWHVHPARQVLLITEGIDYYQEKGKPARIAGREAVVGFLTMILPAIDDVRIGQHLVEGHYVATTFDMTTNGGIDRVFDRICIANGEIRSIRSFYYPQPLQA